MEDVATKERSKSSMLSKVSFRRKESSNGPSAAGTSVAGTRIEAGRVERDRDKGKAREAGHTSFETPSLRQASMSSPALHLSSQAFPSPYSQPFALPAASSSNVSALVSPQRDRFKKAAVNGQGTISTREISGPAPLAPRRDSRTNGSAPPAAVEQKAPKHRPPPVSVQIANAGPSRERTSIDSQLETPTRRTRAGARSPELPPSPTPRSGYLASKRAAASASHLPLGDNTPGSPSNTRPLSPTHAARSPSRTPTTHRPRPSASTSHLPLSSPTTATATPRRPSGELPRASASPTTSRAASPSTPIRPRAASPPQRNYSPSFNRLRTVNASTTSLATAATTEQRELVRNASSLLIKEMLKPPSQIRESGLNPKEYEEVELRLRTLARLERVWGKSGSGFISATQLSSITASGSTGLSAGGEERERRHFCEALRDGYVLCQCVSFFILFPPASLFLLVCAVFVGPLTYSILHPGKHIIFQARQQAAPRPHPPRR